MDIIEGWTFKTAQRYDRGKKGAGTASETADGGKRLERNPRKRVQNAAIT